MARKRGRPARFEDAVQMQDEIEEFFSSCEEEGEIPLISWMEHKLRFRFRDYSDKKGFEDVCAWAREESEAICEQMAFQGRMTKVAASLYLKCKRGYVEESKLTIDNSTKIDMKAFDDVLKNVRELDAAKQDAFADQIREALDEA